MTFRRISFDRHRRHDSRDKRSRAGFTLLEILLVLGVMVLLSALSWPQLTRYLQRQSVLGNAEQVRQVLDRARVRAVEEGRVLQFRFEPGGQHYVLLPYEPISSTPSGAQSPYQSAVPAEAFNTSPPDPYRVYELAEDCQFHVDNQLISGERTVVEHLSDPWLAQLENGLMARDVAWSQPILFEPDGSSTSGSVTVMDEQRRYIRLSVRGLTGTVTVFPLKVMAERYGSTEN